MKRITLSKGKFALVDDEDFEYLNGQQWYAARSGNKYYALRRDKNKALGFQTSRMHREIMSPEGRFVVDHINGNTLDNRKENLRVCTSSENKMNRRVCRSASGFKCVHWHKTRKRWQAYIRINKKRKCLGFFREKESAAIAYDKAAVKYYGEFAATNKMLGLL